MKLKMHACINLLIRSESVDIDATDDFSISRNSSGIFSSGSNIQHELANSFPECIDNNDTSLSDNDALLTDVPSTISVVPNDTDYIERVRDLISDDGLDFAPIVDSAKTFEDKNSLLNATSHPELRWRNKGKQPSWTLNYTVLSFLLNGHNYVEYSSIIGMMGLQVMSQSR